MKKNHLVNYCLFFLLLTCFFLGFYFNEDSAGGGRIDLIEHEWGNLSLFKNKPLLEALTSLNYESSRTPLFLIIHKYNFFINEIQDLRVTTFVFGILILFFYFLCLKKIYKNEEFSLLLLISSLILLSPYLRSSVYWANQEHLSILFLILSLIFLHSSQNENLKDNIISIYLFPVLSSLFAFLAFYSDQKLFFISAIVYFFFIKNKPASFFFCYSLINFLFFIPALYLFYIWGNIVPIESQFRLGITLSNINIFISNIGIYFIPFFLMIFFQRKYENLKLNQSQVFFIILSTLILIFTLPLEPSQEGGGIIFRFLSLMYLKGLFKLDWAIFKIVYLIINIIFLYFVAIFLRSSLKNIFILSSLGLIFYLTYFSYQSYVDPIFLIMIYTLLDTKNTNLTSPKLVYISFIFYSLILVNSLLFRLYII